MADFRIWQDVCKSGERSPTVGQWFTQETSDGHMIDGTLKVHPTLDAALIYTQALRRNPAGWATVEGGAA